MRFALPATGLVLAATFGLTACGGGPETPYTEDDIATAALATRIGLEIPADQAQCTAEKIVASVGTDELTKAGALNEDHVARLNGQFSAAVATKFADATVACWDWRENTTAWAASYPAADAEDWDAYVACAEKLDDELHASVVSTNQKGASAKPRDAFATAQQKCRKVLGTPVG